MMTMAAHNGGSVSYILSRQLSAALKLGLKLAGNLSCKLTAAHS